MRKLNYLLIIPRFVSKVGEGYVFPLGIAYISAVMKEAGFNVFNLNLNHIHGEPRKIVIDELKKNSIDVLMLGGLSPQFNDLKFYIDAVNDEAPEVKIIVGGGIVTAEPETAMMAMQHADIGVIGEGEKTIVELCNKMQESPDDSNLSDIDGIIYKNGETWSKTNERAAIMNLDLIPFPDYEGFGIEFYLNLPQASNSGVGAYMLTARSCPFQCTFCFHSLGEMYRQRSIENIKAELDILVNKFGVRHVDFTDELFSHSIDRVKKMTELAKQYDITWSSSFRIADVNCEMAAILKNGNCTKICLGLESADDRVLESMKKKITVEQIDRALHLLHDSGVSVNGHFIFGDIEETRETAENTLKYWESHKQFNIRLAYILVYPGTHIYKYARQRGIIKDPVQYLKDGCPNVNVSKLTEEDLSYITRRMLDLGNAHVPKPQDIVVLSTENCKLGIISLKGNCEKCTKENEWKNAVVLNDNRWLYCKNCGQKHFLPFPDVLRAVLVENIALMSEYQKVGLWGVNKNTLPMFECHDVFSRENVVFIDAFVQKQMLLINGKKVYAPDEVLDAEVENVVFFYPSSFGFISNEVKQKYPNVKRFINVYELLVETENRG